NKSSQRAPFASDDTAPVEGSIVSTELSKRCTRSLPPLGAQSRRALSFSVALAARLPVEGSSSSTLTSLATTTRDSATATCVLKPAPSRGALHSGLPLAPSKASSRFGYPL